MPNSESSLSQSERDMLVRLDERTAALQKRFEEILAKMQADREIAREEYVTKAEFLPVQRATYAAIGFILTGFLGALGSLLTKH